MTLLTGSANCIKYLLFGFNFLFTITGIILIGVGAKTSGIFEGYESFLEQKYFSLPTFLIVIGAFIFIIAFFGCCGAIRENYCMVFTFSILLILIFILELAAGISGYVLRNETEDIIRENLDKSLSTYGNATREDIAVLWDTMQGTFHCCGVNSYQDWLNSKEALPVSCCSIETGALNTTSCSLASKRLYNDGCLDAFAKYISAHALSLGGAGIALAVIQFAAIFFSCYIAREIKRKYGGSTF